ncbi:MAG: hypothetical protein IPO08_21615 [Xanthomonadales bacterium]|nr:hypothetical protein [Xanthomonadales bacterium]
MATKHALSIYRGEDVTIPWDVDEDITGWTLALVMSDQVMDATPTLTVAATVTTAATGLCEVVLTAAQTAALASRVYQSELCRTNAGALNVLSQGTIAVLPRVGVA